MNIIKTFIDFAFSKYSKGKGVVLAFLKQCRLLCKEVNNHILKHLYRHNFYLVVSDNFPFYDPSLEHNIILTKYTNQELLRHRKVKKVLLYNHRTIPAGLDSITTIISYCGLNYEQLPLLPNLKVVINECKIKQLITPTQTAWTANLTKLVCGDMLFSEEIFQTMSSLTHLDTGMNVFYRSMIKTMKQLRVLIIRNGIDSELKNKLNSLGKLQQLERLLIMGTRKVLSNGAVSRLKKLKVLQCADYLNDYDLLPIINLKLFLVSKESKLLAINNDHVQELSIISTNDTDNAVEIGGRALKSLSLSGNIVVKGALPKLKQFTASKMMLASQLPECEILKLQEMLDGVKFKKVRHLTINHYEQGLIKTTKLRSLTINHYFGNNKVLVALINSSKKLTSLLIKNQSFNIGGLDSIVENRNIKVFGCINDPERLLLNRIVSLFPSVEIIYSRTVKQKLVFNDGVVILPVKLANK